MNFFNFQKVCCYDFALPMDSHCLLAEQYSSVSSAVVLFASWAVNAANLPFFSATSNASLKRGDVPKRKKRLVKRKAIAFAHIGDEERQAYMLAFDMPFPSSPRLIHGTRHGCLS